jgi:hypothetical protein
MAEGIHRALAGGTLAGVVGGDDRVVLNAHHGHPIGRRPQVAVAGLGHVPACLGARTLAARASLGWMDTREGQQLIEVIEAVDVADLGDERRHDRGSDARDRPQPPGEFAVE